MKLAIDENKHHIQTLTKFIDFIKDLTLNQVNRILSLKKLIK